MDGSSCLLSSILQVHKTRILLYQVVQLDESFFCLMGQVLRQVIRFCIAADVRKQTLDEHSPLHTGIVHAEELETFGYVPYKMPSQELSILNLRIRR